MKKLILVCILSLLSATAAFAGFKSKMKAALDKAEEFIEYNLSAEKIEATLEKASNAVERALDKVEEFIECNLDPEKIKESWDKMENPMERALDKTEAFIESNLSPEKIKASWKKATDAVKKVFSKAKKKAETLKESTISAIEKAEKLADDVDHEKIESVLDKGKSVVQIAYDNSKEYVADLNTAEVEASFEEAKETIESFKEKYSEPSFKEKQSPMTDSDYMDMCSEYSVFVTSCMYLSVLGDMAEAKTDVSAKKMQNMRTLLNQLSELMKIQRSGYVGETDVR